MIEHQAMLRFTSFEKLALHNLVLMSHAFEIALICSDYLLSA